MSAEEDDGFATRDASISYEESLGSHSNAFSLDGFGAKIDCKVRAEGRRAAGSCVPEVR